MTEVTPAQQPLDVEDIVGKQTIITHAGTRYLFAIQNRQLTNEGLVVVASDARSVWILHVEEGEPEDINKIISALRKDFTAITITLEPWSGGDNMKILLEESDLPLTIYGGLSSKHATKEIQDLFFHYVERTRTLETEMAAKKPPAPSRSQGEKPSSGPKKTGMSMVNPASKKRKAAQGVVYD